MVEVLADGRRFRVQGRVARMIVWLARNAERLLAIDQVALTFNCAGPRVSAEVKEREPVE